MATNVEEAGRAGSAMSATALSSMFQAIAGLRNTGAVIATLGCFVSAILVAGLLVAVFGRYSAASYFLGGLVAVVLYFTGINAAGTLQMDAARNQPLRGMMDALVYGLVCIPKIIGLAIAIGLVALAVYLVLALILFVCKIPWLGPILFTVAFPVTVVVAGLTVIALSLAFALSICAIWDGASISAAIAKALAILRIRLVETTALFFVVWVLMSFVGAFVFGILAFGLFPALAMSGGILGVGGGMGGMDGMDGMGIMGSILSGMSFGGGYVLAAGIGTGILWALALALVLQVGLLGQNLIYLRVSEGLDSTATEEAIRARLGDARRKASEIAQKAKDAGERARAQVEQAAAQRRTAAQPPPSQSDSPPAPTTSAQPAVCPKCAAPVDPADLFCGSCGQRLG